MSCCLFQGLVVYYLEGGRGRFAGGGVGAPVGGSFSKCQLTFGSQIRERVHLINFMKVVKSIRGGDPTYERVGDARRPA